METLGTPPKMKYTVSTVTRNANAAMVTKSFLEKWKTQENISQEPDINGKKHEKELW